MARITKKDWMKEGVKVLRTKGFTDIRIDRLCANLNVSKGSFYHHFEGIEDYVSKLIDHWEEKVTSSTIGYASKGSSPEDSLQRLQKRVFENPLKLEVQIRAWATFNPVIREKLATVDLKREEFMRERYMEMGHRPDHAKLLAELENNYYIGVIIRQQSAPRAEQANSFRVFEKLLIEYVKPAFKQTTAKNTG